MRSWTPRSSSAAMCCSSSCLRARQNCANTSLGTWRARTVTLYACAHAPAPRAELTQRTLPRASLKTPSEPTSQLTCCARHSSQTKCRSASASLPTQNVPSCSSILSSRQTAHARHASRAAASRVAASLSRIASEEVNKAHPENVDAAGRCDGAAQSAATTAGSPTTRAQAIAPSCPSSAERRVSLSAASATSTQTPKAYTSDAREAGAPPRTSGDM
mmetsp:Transcript_1598/g.3974  ORF Transcript_1598/g.3974 Transcript_1598/m.3974 type:complete len:217 (+) Transcript_1598:578-1228(+)